MVGVARSTLPTRTVGEVLTLRWHKSMPGKGLVCREYFAKPSGPLAKYSLPCGRVCPGRACPGNYRPRTSDLLPSFEPGPSCVGRGRLNIHQVFFCRRRTNALTHAGP